MHEVFLQLNFSVIKSGELMELMAEFSRSVKVARPSNAKGLDGA